MIERTNLQTLTKRMKEPRRFIQVVSGPRQVGKTTMIKQALSKISIPYQNESADTISADSFWWIGQVWESARLRMKTLQAKEYFLIIDEIQKIDNWSEIVKQQWDKDTFENINIKVILCGSSRLLLKHGLTESLAGRFEIIHLMHWSFTEMEAAFGWNINQYLYFGGYPGAAPLIDDEMRWKSYITDSLIETSISRDILMLTRIDKPALLKRLFEIGSLYSGKILSFTKIMGQLQDAGNTTTLANYLRLLSDCGLLGGLEKYAGETVRQRASTPKFQVYNTALFTAQNNGTFLESITNSQRMGQLVESAVGAHLLNYSVSGRYTLYYWREGSYEIDFVLKKGSKIVGLEVKSGAKAVNKGMMIFNKMFHPTKILLVGTGGIPYNEFLKMNPEELF